VIPLRGLLIPFMAALILMATCARSRAENIKIDCDLVRYKVAEYGKARALAWAIENGFTWSQINEARRCLKSK
jgi:hypothetical protein